MQLPTQVAAAAAGQATWVFCASAEGVCSSCVRVYWASAVHSMVAYPSATPLAIVHFVMLPLPAVTKCVQDPESVHACPLWMAVLKQKSAHLSIALTPSLQ